MALIQISSVQMSRTRFKSSFFGDQSPRVERRHVNGPNPAEGQPTAGGPVAQTDHIQMPSWLGFKFSSSDRGHLTSVAFILLAKKVNENIGGGGCSVSAFLLPGIMNCYSS